MKPAPVSQSRSESPGRLEFHVRFSRGPRSQRQVRREERPEQPRSRPGPAHPGPAERCSVQNDARPVPKITRLLILGHHFEKLVGEGVVKDYAEIARLTGLSRARITQIVNLTLLAPAIQERILLLGTDSATSIPNFERDIRGIIAQVDWNMQERRLMT